MINNNVYIIVAFVDVVFQISYGASCGAYG